MYCAVACGPTRGRSLYRRMFHVLLHVTRSEIDPLKPAPASQAWIHCVFSANTAPKGKPRNVKPEKIQERVFLRDKGQNHNLDEGEILHVSLQVSSFQMSTCTM